MTEYDPQIIRKFADRLYRRAKTAIVTFTVLGVLVGGLTGLGTGLAMFAAGGDDPSIAIGGLIAAPIGAAILGVLGYVAGREAAFRLKLQAQTALCQIKIEENTRRQFNAGGSSPTLS